MAAIAKREATVPAQMSETEALFHVIERAATNPNIDIEKMERLIQMQERVMDRNARSAYASALADMQADLPVIKERGAIRGRDILSGEIDNPFRVIEINTEAGTSQDVTREVAIMVADLICGEINSDLLPTCWRGIEGWLFAHHPDTSLISYIDNRFYGEQR